MAANRLSSPGLISRYLFKNLLLATGFVAVTLTMVIWLTQSLRLLDLVTNSDAPAGIFIQLVALTLPRFLEIILPLSLVVAVLFIYNKLIMENELIVLRSCGFDQYTLAKPALMLAGMMSLFLLTLTTYVSPHSYAQMQQMRQSVKTQYSSFLLREGVFNTFSDNMTIYLRAREKNGDLVGLMIHDTRDKSRPAATIFAKRGRIVSDGDVPSIVVFDGMRQQMDEKSHVTTKLSFSRYTIEIKGLESEGATRWREASERTLPELLRPDMTERRDRMNKNLFLAEAHNRILAPFNALGFALVSLCCVLLGPFNRRGQSKKISAAIMIVIAMQAAKMLVASKAQVSLSFVPLLYAVVLLPIAAGLYLLHYNGEQALMAFLRRWRGQGMAGAAA